MKLTWKDLVCIEVGGAICLPVILVGQKLFEHYGLYSAFLGIGIANSILFLIGWNFADMSFKTKLTTTDNAIHYFGPFGVKVFAFSLLIAKSAWFAIQLDMMSQIFGFNPLIKGLLGALILFIALFGLKAITLFSAISMPLLIGTLAYAFYQAKDVALTHGQESWMFEGISVGIGAAITAVVDMPTYFRHARSRSDSLFATIVFLLIAVPLIEGLGIYLASKNPSSSIQEVLTGGGSWFWEIWIATFLLLAGWTTNNTNLFSAATSLGTLCPQISLFTRQLLIGSVGILLSFLELTNHFTTVLQLIGVSIVSMGGVILASYLLRGGAHYNLVAWGCGFVIGILSIFNITTLTSIALVDALLAAFICTFFRRVYEKYYVR